MKKLLLLFFFLPLMAFVKSDWVSVQIDNKASVSFPAKPIQTEVSGLPAWMLDINKDARCVLLSMDLQQLGIDSAQLASEIDTQEGYEGFRNSMFNEFDIVKVISEKKDKLNGRTTFQFKVEVSPKSEGAFTIYHIKNIFNGSKIYTIYFYERKGIPMDDVREKIFSSFKLK